MKKILILGALAAMTAISCSDNAEQLNDSSAVTTNASAARMAKDPKENMADFVKNKAVILLPRVASNVNPSSTKTAKSFALVSYSDVTSTSYVINGEDYNDLGKGNDKEANDGIFTSTGLYDSSSDQYDSTKLQIRFSSEFAFQGQLQQEYSNGTLAIKLPPKVKEALKKLGSLILALCDFSYTFQGNSSLGVPCSNGGCLVVDCL